jgi:hypothetical protein
LSDVIILFGGNIAADVCSADVTVDDDNICDDADVCGGDDDDNGVDTGGRNVTDNDDGDDITE